MNLSKKVQLFLFTCFLCFIFQGKQAFAQRSNEDNRMLFLEAQSYFYYEEYSEALPLFMRLAGQFPENYNITYHLGVCFLHSPYLKHRAIGYLEEAVHHINPGYKESSLRENMAPPEAYFHLGNAYRVNNQLKEATQAYHRFLEIADPKTFNLEVVRDNIKACENAAMLMSEPVNLTKKNVGPPINTRFSDINPVVTPDETVLVYVSKLQFYDAVMVSRKIDGQWSEPVNIMPELGVDGDCYPTSISSDGKELYLYRSDNLIGNLYVSRFENGKWTKVRKLGSPISTNAWESHASISPDGRYLYFTSNRKGGYGGLDIYRSRRDTRGNWGPPENLGPIINTPLNEETPFITNSGRLYFSSHGHHNMGGYDLFYSDPLGNGWTTPVNLGYPVNTTFDDLFLSPVGNGEKAYISRFDPGGEGLSDILILEMQLHKVTVPGLKKPTVNPDSLLRPSSKKTPPEQVGQTGEREIKTVPAPVPVDEKEYPRQKGLAEQVTQESLISPLGQETLDDTLSTRIEAKEDTAIVLYSPEQDEVSTSKPEQGKGLLKISLFILLLLLVFILLRRQAKKNETDHV